LPAKAVDATLGHAQANNAPTADQQAQIVNFESGLFTAQESDNNAQLLHAAGATGGVAGPFWDRSGDAISGISGTRRRGVQYDEHQHHGRCGS
jgi:hypothetical protein